MLEVWIASIVPTTVTHNRVFTS